ncbi:hypothetical protein HK102_001243 [Quaeritorhiza haematococci]|nr:hypothetical protein HK102_001243 [Quaeritorhiza haematococci]
MDKLQSEIKSKFVSSAVLVDDQNERSIKPDDSGQITKEDENYDPRPLYEILADRKRIKEEEFAEKMRFSNLIKRIDEEEFEFLMNRESEEEKKRIEAKRMEREELDEFRKAVAEKQQQPDLDAPTPNPAPPPPRSQTASKPAVVKDFQKSLLSGVVVKKRKAPDEGKSDKDGGVSTSKELTKDLKKQATEAAKSDLAALKEQKSTGKIVQKDVDRPKTTPAPNPLNLLSMYDDESDSNTSDFKRLASQLRAIDLPHEPPRRPLPPPTPAPETVFSKPSSFTSPSKTVDLDVHIPGKYDQFLNPRKAPKLDRDAEATAPKIKTVKAYKAPNTLKPGVDVPLKKHQAKRMAQIHETITDIFQCDPLPYELTGLEIIKVTLTPTGKSCVVWWRKPPELDVPDDTVQSALEHYSHFLRGLLKFRLGRGVHEPFIPHLEFRKDSSHETIEKLNKAMDRIEEEVEAASKPSK